MRSDIEKYLLSVQKPARYIGNEMGSVHKDKRAVDIRFVFAFPDVYDVGMSHLGIKILYHMLNEREDVFCERVFSPWVDFEDVLRENNIPLFALESGDSLNEFDFVGFTLQYELSYTNILNMLDMSHIPVLSQDRKEADPFVIAGGPCAFNPEPLADFFDFFVLGESEESLNEILDLYKTWKAKKLKRQDFLKMASEIDCVYVPAFYKPKYNNNGTLDEMTYDQAIGNSGKARITKRIVTDLDKVYYPKKLIVPFTEIVHDRIMLEIFRGCTHGCRFCQAGMIYRPVRERSMESLLKSADKLIESTGYEDISLVSLSTCDYSDIEPLVYTLIDRYKDKGVGVSLPSLRIDTFSVNLIEQIQKVRKTGLTFAPEAGTQRLRDVINKGVTEQNLVDSVTDAFKMGWSTIKLYFMIGLPTETYEDLDGIKDLAYEVIDIYKSIKGSKKGLKVTVSASSFVPKPFTPFQWETQNRMKELKNKQNYLKSILRDNAISYSWQDTKMSFLEAVISRGDRKVGKAIYKAWQKGCKYDGWGNFFKFDTWMKAFEETGVDPEFYAYRQREYDELFPWDIINAGIDKDFLIREHKKALKGMTTADCRENCVNCGIKKLWEGLCHEKKD